MATNTVTRLVPEYVNQFKCVGAECEDTCCAGWQVSIDRATYKKYNKVRSSELKELLDKHIKRTRIDASESNYAHIELNSCNTCPFLSQDGLCTVQLNLGEEYLSHTCATYPRINNAVEGIYEQALTMSCPEASRLALTNKQPMEFVEEKTEGSPKHLASTLKPSPSDLSANNLRFHFWPMRVLTIQVLQNRNYSISERLVILGMFYSRANEIVKAGNIEDLTTLVHSYTNLLLDAETFKKSIATLPPQPHVQLQLVRELTHTRVAMGVSSTRYIECFADFLKGIGAYEGATSDNIIKTYQEAYNEYFQPWMAQHEYILENYLVNYVFLNLFPFDKKGNLFSSYVELVLNYAIIKLHLIGMSGFHKGLSTDLALKLIQSYSRSFEHNAIYRDKVLNILESNGYDTLAHMILLIQH